MHRGRRSPPNWKYNIIKSMRRRAVKFYTGAITVEKKEAWQEVIDWFDSFISPDRRFFTHSGAIGIVSNIPKILLEEGLDNVD